MRRDKDIRVLMIGPHRKVMGGVSSVVNEYFNAKLDDLVHLKYHPTMIDGNKAKKLIYAMASLLVFLVRIPFFDVLHVHMASRASFYRKRFFIAVARLYRKKVIVHMHGAEFHLFYEEELNDIRRNKVQQTLCHVQAIISLSAQWRQFYEKAFPEPLHVVIPNGIVIPGPYVRSHEANVLFLGYVGTRKGIFDIMETIASDELLKSRVRLSIGGNGEIERLRREITRLELQKNVTYAGWLRGEAKDAIYRENSIFLLPSYNEGLPMALLEAMSHGMAVIASDVGGIPHLLESGVNGFMIKPGDIAQLKERLKQLIQDPELQKSLGLHAYQTIQRSYDVRRIVNDVVSLYHEVLSSSGKHPMTEEGE